MSGRDDYVEVSERIVEFRAKYPDGRLRPADPARPYSIEIVGDTIFVVVVAAAYRTPDDPAPGIGMAWERCPGKTNFTRDSELQNAETSAWGRAMVAALAADTKRGIASADEVRARSAAKPARAAQPEPTEPAATTRMSRTSRPSGHAEPAGGQQDGMSEPQRRKMMTEFKDRGFTGSEDRHGFIRDVVGIDVASSADLTYIQASQIIDALLRVEA